MPLISDTLTNANFFRGILGYDLNETYAEVAANVNVVRDDASDITLEYSTMNGSISVKQADVILDTYPLGYSQNYSQADALSDLDYVSFPLKDEVSVLVLTRSSMRTSNPPMVLA